jgi:hypothetical protein
MPRLRFLHGIGPGFVASTKDLIMRFTSLFPAALLAAAIVLPQTAAAAVTDPAA